MKVVVVMSYYERPFQLHETLLSIARTEYKNFEVVVVTDTTQTKFKIPKVPYRISVLECNKDTTNWVGSMMAFNTGFLYAQSVGAEVVIIQHAECYHVGDVIARAAEITDRNYISFGCYSINELTTFTEHNIFEVIKSNDTGANNDGENAWYNHPTKRPVGYHFCSAITMKNLKQLNGFDERFLYGIAYDDNDFIHRIKLMRLRVDIPLMPFVVHQWHFSGHGAISNKSELMQKNKELFIALKRNANLRALHIVTQDL